MARKSEKIPPIPFEFKDAVSRLLKVKPPHRPVPKMKAKKKTH